MPPMPTAARTSASAWRRLAPGRSEDLALERVKHRRRVGRREAARNAPRPRGSTAQQRCCEIARRRGSGSEARTRHHPVAHSAHLSAAAHQGRTPLDPLVAPGRRREAAPAGRREIELERVGQGQSVGEAGRPHPGPFDHQRRDGIESRQRRAAPQHIREVVVLGARKRLRRQVREVQLIEERLEAAGEGGLALRRRRRQRFERARQAGEGSQPVTDLPCRRRNGDRHQQEHHQTGGGAPCLPALRSRRQRCSPQERNQRPDSAIVPGGGEQDQAEREPQPQPPGRNRPPGAPRRQNERAEERCREPQPRRTGGPGEREVRPEVETPARPEARQQGDGADSGHRPEGPQGRLGGPRGPTPLRTSAPG